MGGQLVPPPSLMRTSPSVRADSLSSFFTRLGFSFSCMSLFLALSMETAIPAWAKSFGIFLLFSPAAALFISPMSASSSCISLKFGLDKEKFLEVMRGRATKTMAMELFGKRMVGRDFGPRGFCGVYGEGFGDGNRYVQGRQQV
ncbi:6-phosphogluconate dehydrogenase NAD-binding domain-containing protein [Striga asiatica]|uniref:6-phosphogluconate dehydrogenase NAD-binding domain-containing protein n=1 Tax=Striga asiatica TaxID=4170 RepID=A0A5A7PK51_STRAF|nr:6-phosphogluconate dehydrogenase NAD-binding domain-containing protein [Striga asiatica]